MSNSAGPDAKGYDAFYQAFDSASMRSVRAATCGEDIGQNSWVTADEVRSDIARLRLSAASHVLDLGCGPCGPLTFILSLVGCHGTGTELSTAALAAGRARAAALGVDQRLTLRPADLNEPLPFADGAFDAALSLDVVLHLRDRAAFFGEVARVVRPGARFVFTDAGVVTGSISEAEVARRSLYGFTQFSAPGFNERLLERAGFRVVDTEDRTASVLTNAAGRLEQRLARRGALEELEGASGFERQRRYLETVIEITRRGAVSRRMYLAESRPAS